jgi:hypothetical protein
MPSGKNRSEIKWTGFLIMVLRIFINGFQPGHHFDASYLFIRSIRLLKRYLRRSRYHALCQIGFYCVSSSLISPSIFEGRRWSNASKVRPIGTFQDNNGWLIRYRIYLMHGPWGILTVKFYHDQTSIYSQGTAYNDGWFTYVNVFILHLTVVSGEKNCREEAERKTNRKSPHVLT